MKKDTLLVKGMSCASCAATVEKNVGKMPGVKEAHVNLMTEKLTVVHDDIKMEEIKKVVNSLGYKALDYKEKNIINDNKKINNKKIMMSIMIILSIIILYIAMGPMFNAYIPNIINPKTNALNYALVELFLTLPVILLGYNFYISGYKHLFKLSPNMDSLIAVGTTASFLYSINSLIQIINGNNHYVHNLYFETTVIIITLVTFGKYLEDKSKRKTNQAIKKLIELTPKTALILKDNDEVIVSVDDIKKDDVVIVKSGERIPVDGIILEGTGAVDESMLTGESIPNQKLVGDNVVGGSINKNGYFKFKVTKTIENSVLSQIIKLVNDAQESKAPIAKLADKFSGYFVPTIIITALLSSLLWYFNGQTLEFSITIFVSVLTIACPCALGLATPTAVMVATGKAAELGILFKDAESLELIHKVDTIVFDKTGTLTKGQPVITDIISNDYNNYDLLVIAASMEMGSEHPFSQAIISKAKDLNIILKKVDDYIIKPGLGIEGKIEGSNISIGNIKLMRQNNQVLEDYDDIALELSYKGKTPIYISIDTKVIGIIAVADTLKETSIAAISCLKEMGKKTIMLTGDNKNTAYAIANELGIDEVIYEVMPEDKVEKIKDIQKSGNIVAMVGDGINDAPAIMQSDVGIVVGSGTDVALESGSVILIHNDLNTLVTAINLSKAAIKNIKQNLFWAFFYNILGIPVAAGVLYVFNGPLLNPMIGALAMSLSSVSVVTNALRLNNFKDKK